MHVVFSLVWCKAPSGAVRSTRMIVTLDRQHEIRVGARSPDLWAITCYFNPVGYQRRAQNYHIFRSQLGIPLITVELSSDDNFQLRQGDSDILVQVTGRDVMWQKERLLNVALQVIPDDCKQIAWLDCDVVFATDDWAERASRALDRHALVHLYDQRHNLPPDAVPINLDARDDVRPTRSVVQKMVNGEASAEDFFLAGSPLTRRTTCGLAWASRRDLLVEHGLYDACILGSGDRAILNAALGQFDHGAQAASMTAPGIEHYLEWAKPYFDSVNANVGHIEGKIFHLWHGDLQHRAYGERGRLLEEFQFDPFIDIVTDRSSCWRWNSDKHALHERVRRYFELRKEDGEQATA